MSRPSLLRARVLLAVLVPLLPLLLCSAGGQDLPPSSTAATVAFKRLSDRMSGPSSDQGKLQQDLLDFRVRFPGTSEARQVIELLSRLPSPLDKLDPAKIPALEKFAWQPKDLVAVLGEHRGRHGTIVSCVAVSPDSKLVASGGSGLVRVWDSLTMRLKSVMGHGGSGVTCLAFSRDSKGLVVGSASGTVLVWDLTKPEQPAHRFTISASTSPVYSVAFAHSGKAVAAGCFDNVARIFDISGSKAEMQTEVTGHTKPVSAVTYSPDGKHLITGSNDQTVRVWNINGSDFKEQARLEGHPNSVTCLAFNPKGTTLASGCADGSIRLWNYPASPKPPARVVIPVAKTGITTLSFSGTGNTLAVTCGDANVHLWSIAGGKVREVSQLEGHAGTVTSAVYAPNMSILVSGGLDWTVRTWDLSKPKIEERFVPWSHLSHVYSVAFSPDGGTLASGSEDRVVRFWDLTRPEPRTRNFLKMEKMNPPQVYAVAYSPDGKLIAAAGANTTVRQWEAATGRVKANCPGHPSHVYQIAYTPDGKHLVTSSDKLAFLFDVAKGGEVQRFTGHDTRIHCMSVSPDGKRLLTGSGYYLYDKDGKIVIKDGKYVYTDCTLRLWDVQKGEMLQSTPDTTPFYGVSFTGDGKEIFGGVYEPELKRWTINEDKLTAKKAIPGIVGYPYGLVPTLDGKSIFCRGLDNKLILWDVATGERRKDWAFNESIGHVALSLDGRHMAVSLSTGVVYVLRLAPLAGGNS